VVVAAVDAVETEVAAAIAAAINHRQP